MLFIYPPQTLSISGNATEAKQDVQITEAQTANTELANINTELDSQTTLLGTIDVDTGAIAGSTASIDTKTPALVSGRVPVDGSAVTQPISVTSLPLPTGAATEASLAAAAADLADLNARLGGSLTAVEHDYIEITYIGAGPGAGEIGTVVYKTGGAAGTTVATLTLVYDGSNRLTSVTRT